MKVSAALEGIRRLYIDTAPLIYFVEENPAYVTKMDTVIAAVDGAAIEAVSLVITLTEVLVHPMRLKNIHLEGEYRDILFNSKGFHLQAVTARIAEAAAGLRARYDLHTPDALHIATAIEAGCDAFLTNDAGIKRVTELGVLILDELESDLP